MLNGEDMNVTVSEDIVRSLLDAPSEAVEDGSAPPEATEIYYRYLQIQP